MAEDVIIILSAATSAAFVVMSFMLLSRYRRLASSTNESGKLVRDLWESLQGRLKRQDERIVDLMARVELYGLQSSRQVVGEGRGILLPRTRAAYPEEIVEEIVETSRSHVGVGGGGTELNLLRALLDGPKTSVGINRLIGKSREHTARVMKLLFESGLVERDTTNKPFVYKLTEKGRRHLERASG